jgi:F0F1-type ATP synthase assembly protein I
MTLPFESTHVTFVALYCLATLDGMFMGYREAAGRHGAIDKRAYYARAMMRGALMVQLAVAVVLAIALGAFLLGAGSWSQYRAGAARFLAVVLPYALVLGAAFRARASSNVDIKSLANVLVFGPFTLLRWPLILAATAYAAWGRWRWPMPLLYLAMLACMRAVELALRRRRWQVG